MAKTPVNELDGCELDFSEDPTDDDDITAFALFASASSKKDVEAREAEWKELFDGS